MLKGDETKITFTSCWNHLEAASLPSKELWEAYEEKRKAYLDRKYAEYLAETQRRGNPQIG